MQCSEQDYHRGRQIGYEEGSNAVQENQQPFRNSRHRSSDTDHGRLKKRQVMIERSSVVTAASANDENEEATAGESENGDGDGGGDGSGDEGGGGGEQLSALAKLQQHATSQTVFHRQMVGRVLVDIFRNAVDFGIQLPVEEMMILIGQISVDPEPSVRSELVEQVPHVAMICQEATNRFGHVLPQHLLGIVIDFLRDDDNQVRKTAQAALLVLMERGLLEKEPIEELICPSVLELSYVSDPSPEIHMGAVTLMCKMAPLIGRELTERLFLGRFVDLCVDETFYVRKVCAANFADFCAAASRTSVENILLPRFIDLCTDEVWDVRKACAEVMMSVSCCVSLRHRQLSLAPVFAAMLSDISRWVRISAYQALGPFIATFAQQFTELSYNQYGEVVFTDQRGTELKYKLSFSNPRPTVLAEVLYFGDNTDDNFESEDRGIRKRCRRTGWRKTSDGDTTTADGEVSHDDTEKFNPFQYYYVSPEMPLDLEIVEAGRSPPKDENDERKEENAPAESRDNKVKESKENSQREGASNNDSQRKGQFDIGANSLANFEYKRRLANYDPGLNDTMEVSSDDSCDAAEDAPRPEINPADKYDSDGSYQSIVPQTLIDNFVMLPSSSLATDMDAKIPHHCAFSFPAVALTLGRGNWHLLVDAYRTLTCALQWKVRRTLASSIHELAIILGEDLAARDLVPIYDGFIKDLDEVRIGALKHLATFLKVLRPQDRRQYLHRFDDFLVTDPEWNWRFREELANQLLEAVDLFNPVDVSEWITTVALHLLVDKVAAVRTVALALVTQIISYLSVDEALVTALVRELGNMFPRSAKWTHRQTYGILCSQLITNGAITADRFSREMLPHLIDLSLDTVPNVRLSVARTLARYVATRGPEWQGGPEQAEAVKTKLKHLRQDADRDVREHAVLIRTH
ncbi:serine/threonine-protein phosphatase 4 regulatory subunit 1-like isoform X2 [Athalia rosae]|nr:serine/threonine-protein phosphatase 4 regulatory subunit 1-like isoform X2 [Athalia rosae]